MIYYYDFILPPITILNNQYVILKFVNISYKLTHAE